MEIYTVYKITNTDTGIVEYVGQTVNLEKRWLQHTKAKPGVGCGKFYQRTNVVMEDISSHRTKGEAKHQEKHWQIHYDCEDRSDYACRKLTFDQAEEIRSKYMPYKYTLNTLADEYGVSMRVIRMILNNITYQTI